MLFIPLTKKTTYQSQTFESWYLLFYSIPIFLQSTWTPSENLIELWVILCMLWFLGSQPSEYLEVAEKASAFIRTHLYDEHSHRLTHSFRNGPSKAPGFLDDYAFLISGLLDLYESGGSIKWLKWAVDLQATQACRWAHLSWHINIFPYQSFSGCASPTDLDIPPINGFPGWALPRQRRGRLLQHPGRRPFCPPTS